MNFDMFFRDVIFKSYPIEKDISVFACDDIYFTKYGKYTLISLDKVGYNTHIHIINPTKESISEYENLITKLKNTHSLSIETLDLSQACEPERKSYYFMSRFFLAQHLFESCQINSMSITDSDLIFNEKINVDKNINIAFNYRPERSTLWERSAAYFVYVTSQRRSFIDNMIKEYRRRHRETDFEVIPNLKQKLDRVNLAGLDQVCLTFVLEQENLKEDFLNLRTIEGLESKGEHGGKIWVLVGKNKRLLTDDYLRNKFKEYC